MALGERPELFQWAAWEWGDTETTTVVAATPDPSAVHSAHRPSDSPTQPPHAEVLVPAAAAVESSTHSTGSSSASALGREHEMKTMGHSGWDTPASTASSALASVSTSI